MNITPEELGKIIYDSFNVEGWGTVGSYSFEDPPKKDSDDVDAGLYEVLEIVCNKLNARTK